MLVAVVFVMSLSLVDSTTVHKITMYDATCTDAGPDLYLREGANSICYAISIKKSVKLNTVSSPRIEVFLNGDCSGTPEGSIDDGGSNCEGGLILDTSTTSVPQSGGKIRKRINLNSTVTPTKDEHVSMTLEMAADTCLPSDLFNQDNTNFNYMKVHSAELSSDGVGNTEEKWVTTSYYSDDACTRMTWSDNIMLLHSVYQLLQRSIPGPDMTCYATNCGNDKSTIYGAYFGSTIHYNEGNTPEESVDYVRIRFYQDQTCRHPTTYMDPDSGVTNVQTYNGANTDQTGSLNTDGTWFQVGEQTYDGNAPGRVLYVPLFPGNNAPRCTPLETGSRSNTINSIECQAGATELCTLYNSVDCTGSGVSVLNDTSTCNSDIFAKAEAFGSGIITTSEQFTTLMFAATGAGTQGFSTAPRKAQECGGTPTILTGHLDQCMVNEQISKGHTWANKESNSHCKLDWDTQFQAATTEPDVDACKARCYSDVECLAISFGVGEENNHKCVLCKDVTTQGHSSWDTYQKIPTPPFVKVTTSTHSINDFKTTYHTTSDCTGVGIRQYNRLNRLSTCRNVPARASGGRAVDDDQLGEITYTSAMTAEQKFATVKGAGKMQAGDSYASDQVGCPNVVVEVDEEGLYTLPPSNGVNNHRVCTITFTSRPGVMLSLHWNSFDIQSGSCSGTPANCNCQGESVTIRDGLRPDAQQVGQPLCGNQLPNNILLSGNTGQINYVGTAETSTFSVWVGHNINRLNFHLPKNPTFKLGSHISVKYSTDTSASPWDECETGPDTGMHGVGRNPDGQWQRSYTCARSPSQDHGWVGIYRNGTCESGAMLPHADDPDEPSTLEPGFLAHAFAAGQKPHECYLGYRSIPIKETRGSIIFRYNEDYNEAGYYSLRYFAGDAGGRVCEVQEHGEQVHDPAENKFKHCILEPVAQAVIYVSSDPAGFSGTTQQDQTPGFERYINF